MNEYQNNFIKCICTLTYVCVIQFYLSMVHHSSDVNVGLDPYWFESKSIVCFRCGDGCKPTLFWVES